MKTLPKSITETFYNDKGSYELIVSNFKALARDSELRKTLRSVDYLLYAILRGRDWTKCFAKVYSKDPSFIKSPGYTEGVIDAFDCLRTVTYPEYNYFTKYCKDNMCLWCKDLTNLEILNDFCSKNLRLRQALAGDCEPYLIKEPALV